VCAGAGCHPSISGTQVKVPAASDPAKPTQMGQPTRERLWTFSKTSEEFFEQLREILPATI